jgi:hypothetical protein
MAFSRERRSIVRSTGSVAAVIRVISRTTMRKRSSGSVGASAGSIDAAVARGWAAAISSRWFGK